MSGQKKKFTEPAVGERVLAAAVQHATDLWSTRLLAAYALGSLAHGGFSVYVSDVDLGLVIDTVLPQDADAVETLATRVAAETLPLAERLSIFWGSPATLSGEATGGRFPPLDRLDLLEHGRLLAGRDQRDQIPVPSQRDLILAGATYALQTLSTPELTAELRDVRRLAASGVRTLTKRILFPVRILFTARTGEIGRNQDAVEHFAAAERGPATDLAVQAYEWRSLPPDPTDPSVISTIAAGLLPLYRLFVDEYALRLREYSELDIAEQFGEWRLRLE
jgi:hypothetical protein